MWLFLKKNEFIEKLIKIRASKLREQEYKNRKKVFLSEAQKKELINSKDILDVIGEYAELPARHTKTRNIKCPLPSHDDKTASFHIYPDTNSFYCFGCRRGGGIVQFVKHIKSISDKEAFKELFPRN
jgi:DNA primase